MTETVSDERLRELAQGYETWSKTNSSRPQIDKDTASALRELLALRAPPQNTDGEAVAWQADWPDDPAFPEWTLNRTTAEKWHERGAMITPLVPASTLSAMKAERDAAPKVFCAMLTTGVCDLPAKLAAVEAARDADRRRYEEWSAEITVGLYDLKARVAAAEAERDALAKALDYAAMGLGRIHDSLTSTAPKQAVGEMTMHFRDEANRARSTLQGDAK